MSLNAELNSDMFGSVDFPAARVGYGITDRIMVGARINSRIGFTAYGNDFNANGSFLFARYYFLLRQRTRLFAEVGVGSTKVLRDRLVTYNLAAGLEYQLTPGIVATGLLAYNGAGSQQNTVELTFGFAAYLNQLSQLRRGIGFERGTIVLNQNWGTLLFSDTDSPLLFVERSVSFDFNPRAGYFVSDHLMLEAGLSASHNRRKFNFDPFLDTNDTRTAVGVSAGLRYLPFPEAKFSPYVGGEVGYEVGNRDSIFDTQGSSGGSDVNFSTNYVAASLGVMHRLSDHLSIDLNAQYSSSQYDDSESAPFSRFNGVRLSLGLKALLVRGRK